MFCVYLSDHGPAWPEFCRAGDSASIETKTTALSGLGIRPHPVIGHRYIASLEDEAERRRLTCGDECSAEDETDENCSRPHLYLSPNTCPTTKRSHYGAPMVAVRLDRVTASSFPPVDAVNPR